MLVEVAVGQVALLLAEAADDVGKHGAVARGAGVFGGVLVRSAQVFVLVVEITASGIVASVCIYRIARSYRVRGDMLRRGCVTRGGGGN